MLSSSAYISNIHRRITLQIYVCHSYIQNDVAFVTTTLSIEKCTNHPITVLSAVLLIEMSRSNLIASTSYIYAIVDQFHSK